MILKRCSIHLLVTTPPVISTRMGPTLSSQPPSIASAATAAAMHAATVHMMKTVNRCPAKANSIGNAGRAMRLYVSMECSVRCILFLIAALPLSATLAVAQTTPAPSPATASCYELLMASANAAKAGKAEDAIFYFYAGQLRRRLETGVFPPDNEAGESEGVYALQYQLGSSINITAADNPAAQERALVRYDAWTPVLPSGFKPLWRSSHPASAAAVQGQIAATKKDFSMHMHQINTLMRDPEYYRLFHVSRDCNMMPKEKAPTPANCKGANDGLLRIEKQRGIEGVATLHAKDN